MKQLILGGNRSQGSVATKYTELYGSDSWDADIATRLQLVATAGKIKNLRVKLDTAPGAGTSWAYTLMVNEVATALTCTIADTATTGSDTTNEVTVSAGDTICIRAVPTGTPAVPRSRYSIIFDGDTVKESILPGGSDTTYKTETRYNVLAGSDVWSATDVNYGKQVIPTPGVIKNLYVKLGTAPGTAPDAYKFTLQVNGVASALTVTITGTATTGNNTSNSITVAAGDLVQLIVEPLNIPTNDPRVSWGTCFVADTDGESVVLGKTGELDTNATEYIPLPSMGVTLSGTETDKHQPAQGSTAKKLYIEIGTAPGAGKSYTFTLRKNGVDTALTVTIAGTDKTGNDTTNSVNLIDDDDINLEITPTGAPAVSVPRWGMVITVGAIYPTDAITRVTNLIHRYSPGNYTLEVALGEVTSDFGLPEWTTQPRASTPDVEKKKLVEEQKKLVEEMVKAVTPTVPEIFRAVEAGVSREELIVAAAAALDPAGVIAALEARAPRRLPTPDPTKIAITEAAAIFDPAAAIRALEFRKERKKTPTQERIEKARFTAAQLRYGEQELQKWVK